VPEEGERVEAYDLFSEHIIIGIQGKQVGLM
jgi:hypothetical protein